MYTYHIFIVLGIVYSLVLCIRMMGRKVFVIRPKAWTFAGWLIALALYCIILLFYPEHIRWRSPDGVEKITLFSDLLAVAALLAFFLFTLLAPPIRTVFNVTRDSLYEGLFEALEKHGIDYEQPKKVSTDRYEMVLKGIDASIRIAGLFSTNSITLVFKGSKNIPGFRRLLDDFRTIMRGKELSERSRHAIGMLVLYSLLAFFILVPILLLVIFS